LAEIVSVGLDDGFGLRFCDDDLRRKPNSGEAAPWGRMGASKIGCLFGGYIPRRTRSLPAFPAQIRNTVVA
jgi:hypothetical protein